MRVLYRWTVGKQIAESHLNDDSTYWDDLKGVCAISDGASESFASRLWADRLVLHYVQRPHIDKEWLAQSIASYNEFFDRTAMRWSAQAAFDRGSFATLLGLRFDPSDPCNVTVLGIGDSLAVLDDGADIHDTFPYSRPEQFRANPRLLSTIRDRNTDILAGEVERRWRLDGINSPKLYCMTDAIGAWLLSARAERMARLRALQRPAEFFTLVEEARADGAMRRDDTTLLVIG
jgi:hypothetical protein